VQLALAIRLERDIVQRQRLEEERKLNELALRQARDAAETANRELQLVNAQLSNLATTDTLTGAWNRRHFEQELQRELIQSQRYGEPLSLLMFDIDHFKAVNDRYGHPVGDAVLVGLTRLVQRNLRAADTLARWGGEEFVIMLPHCSADEAASLAEKLRALLAEQTFESVGQVTASFGVTQCRPDDSPQSWLKRADLALYQAKAEGRNAVRLVA
jgi:diguanylate cyclase (GGDEF)-like protein